MTYLHASLTGLGDLINFSTLIGLLIGIVWGMIISFMPGVGGNVALALLLGTHIATYFGGSITSITLNIPASMKSMPLCWDGFPLATAGRGSYALGASASASGIGGVIGAIALTIGIPIMRSLLNYLGPPEILLLAVLGAILIAILSSGNLTKGMIAFAIGIILSWVGQDAITGVNRLTFGSLYLSNGIQVADVAIGLFAIVQVMRLISEPDRMRVRPVPQTRRPRGERIALRERLRETDSPGTSLHGLGAVLRHWKLELYMALFGVFTGTVPGFGAPVAAVAAYGQAAQFSKSETEFGAGAIEGVIAPQATESAAEGGGMLPLLSLGIPTHEQQAILLAAFVTIGIAPGPAMLSTQLPTVFSIIWLIVGASLAMMLIGLLLARQFAKLSTIPTSTLVPLILTVATVGSFAVNGRIGDVITTGIIGIAGYFFWRFNYSRINLIIGLVLGPIIESNLHITTSLYGDGFMFKRPLAGGIALVTVVTLALWARRVVRDRRDARRERIASGDAAAQRERAGFHPKLNGATVTAVIMLGVFVAVAAIARTYSSLTGGDLFFVAGIGAVLSFLNLLRILRGEETEDMGVGERLRRSGKGSVGKALRSPQPAHEAPMAGRPAGGGLEAAPALATSAVATEIAESLEEVFESPEAEVRAEAPKSGMVLQAIATVAGFFALAYVVGIVPAAGLGFGLYNLVVRRQKLWYCLAVTLLVGVIAWLLFHFLVNAYAPYQGFVHFLPS